MHLELHSITNNHTRKQAPHRSGPINASPLEAAGRCVPR